MSRFSTAALASTVAAAISLAASPAFAQSSVKCYGISKAGQNDCANAAKTHDCKGMSKVNYDLADWKGVRDIAECTKLGGSYTPAIGPNPKAPKA